MIEFLLSGSVILIFLFLAFTFRIKHKQLTHYLFITIWLLLIGFLVLELAEIHQFETLITVTSLLVGSLGFLIGPLLFLFTKKSLTQQKLRPIEGLHMLPFLIHWTCISLPPVVYPSALLLNTQNEIMLTALENLYMLVYVALALKLVLKQKRIDENSHQRASIKWFTHLFLATLFVLSIDLLVSAYEVCFGPLGWYSGNITIITVFISLFLLTYSAIESGFIKQLYKSTTPVTKATQFTPIEANALKGKLTALLEIEKRYRDPSLTLSQLAKEMTISTKNLSLFINHHLNTNFYDLINTYRIVDSTKKLNAEAYAHYSIMGIANDSGFKSKTTFYRIFKQKTSMSPTEFKKSKCVPFTFSGTCKA